MNSAPRAGCQVPEQIEGGFFLLAARPYNQPHPAKYGM